MGGAGGVARGFPEPLSTSLAVAVAHLVVVPAPPSLGKPARFSEVVLRWWLARGMADVVV